jgi:LysR family transcriptional regulator, regulator for metE and metH
MTAAPRLTLPVRLEVRDMRLVTAVAGEGSLTQAGVRLNVTQPALSRHLAELEGRIGTTLFTRTGSRMQPTPAGELLLRHARDLLERVAATETELRDLQHTPRRTLRVGTDCYTGYHWLPGVVSRYGARHPHIEVEIAFDAAGDPVRRLRTGDVDVALVTDGGNYRGLATRPLFTDEYIAVVAPGHRLSTRSFIDAADLSGERVLLMSDPASSNVMQQFIKPAGIRPRLVADVQLVGAVAALAESDFGVGMVPSWTIAPEVRSGRLIALRLGKSGFQRVWTAVMTKSLARERWLQDFVQSIAADVPSLGLQPVAAKN